jgi:hypothetical protein
MTTSSGTPTTPGSPRGRGRPSASRGRALRGLPLWSRSRSGLIWASRRRGGGNRFTGLQ